MLHHTRRVFQVRVKLWCQDDIFQQENGLKMEQEYYSDSEESNGEECAHDKVLQEAPIVGFSE